ncbi:MAG: hypothetical protein V4714_14020 [Bacteroidota bacterium]
MIDINKDKSVTISFTLHSMEELYHFQTAIIDAIADFNYDERGLEAGSTMHYIGILLKEVRPNEHQMLNIK